MGNWFCKKTEQRVIIQGLDAAGKTSLLYRLKLGEVVTTIPTIGFNVETIAAGGLTITCWDLGGRDKMRPLFRHYYANTQGFVYVIDSADKDRLDQALEELVRYVFLEEEAAGTVVMVLANKQDIPRAMTPFEIEAALSQKYKISPTSASNHTVFVRPCSVVTGEGIFEAFQEFADRLRLKTIGKAETGLVPLVDGSKAEAQVAPKYDALKSGKNVGNDGGRESLTLATAKMFFKDPFSYLKSMFLRPDL